MITSSDATNALRLAGLRRGMTVFSHSNIAFFGRIENTSCMDDLVRFMLDCYLDVLGPDGTLVLPVFTYSFGSDKDDKVFDLQTTLSKTSAMGNWLVTSGAGCRSADPMLSVVAMGSRARELTADIDLTCFGPQSIWARLWDEDAMICNLNLDSGSTYLHWVERELGVSYRTDIPMSGTVIDNGRSQEMHVTYTGRDLRDPGASASFESYHRACMAQGISKVTSLGRGQIVSQSARDAKSFLEVLLKTHPYLLTSRHQP